jgi:hypothetical protein
MVGNKCEIMCSIPCIYVFLTFSIIALYTMRNLIWYLKFGYYDLLVNLCQRLNLVYYEVLEKTCKKKGVK